MAEFPFIDPLNQPGMAKGEHTQTLANEVEISRQIVQTIRSLMVRNPG